MRINKKCIHSSSSIYFEIVLLILFKQYKNSTIVTLVHTQKFINCILLRYRILYFQSRHHSFYIWDIQSYICCNIVIQYACCIRFWNFVETMQFFDSPLWNRSILVLLITVYDNITYYNIIIITRAS